MTDEVCQDLIHQLKISEPFGKSMPTAESHIYEDGILRKGKRVRPPRSVATHIIQKAYNQRTISHGRVNKTLKMVQRAF